MKAIKYTSYGSPDVLQLVELEKPVPANNEILIRIHATTVTATEATFRKGEPYFSRLFTGVTKPKLTTLGEELSGANFARPRRRPSRPKLLAPMH